MKKSASRAVRALALIFAAVLLLSSCGKQNDAPYESFDGAPKKSFEEKVASFGGIYDDIAAGIPMPSAPGAFWKLNDGLLTLSGSGSFVEADPAALGWRNFGAYVEAVEVTGSVGTVGTYAFAGFGNLRTVKFDAGAGSVLGYGIFSGCASLETVDLGDAVEEIGAEAFAGCTSLREIVIPKTVWYIWPDAFKGCTSLERVVYGGTRENWEAIGIDYGNELLETVTIEYAPAE